MTVVVDPQAEKAAQTAPFVYGDMLLGDALLHQQAARRPATRAALVAALCEVIL